MKKSFCLFVFLSIGISGFSEEVSFLGVKLGSSFEEAVGMLKQRSSLTFEGIKGDTAWFNGDFAGFSKCDVSIVSYGELLTRGYVFVPAEDGFIQTVYNNAVQLYTQKYGVPTESTREFLYPYRSGAPNEDMAIKNNKAVILSVWDLDGALIKITIFPKAYSVVMVYEHKALVEKQKAKNQEEHLNDI